MNISYIIYNSIFYFNIIFITFYLTSNYNILTQLLTLDSIFTSINFLINNINQDLSVSQIINKSNKLYNSSLFDRYIYYILTSLFYYVFLNFFYLDNCTILFILILLTSVPDVLNKILMLDYFVEFNKNKKYLIKILISKQIAYIIRLSSKIYLNKTLDLDYLELMLIFDDYDLLYNNFIKSFTTFLLVFVISRIKDKSSIVYYKLTKYVYNYITGEYLVSYDEESAKKLLLDVITNKKWENILKPNIYSSIIYLVNNTINNSTYFRDLIINFNYKFSCMIAVWTLTSVVSFANYSFMPALLNISLIYYKQQRYISYKDFIALIISCFIKNIFFANLICQFGGDILLNKLTYNFYNFLFNYLRDKIYSIYTKNKIYNMYIIFLFIVLLVTKYVNIGLIQLIYNSLIADDYKKLALINILLISCYLSQYNIFHIVHNMCVLYFLISLDIFNKIIKTNIIIQENYCDNKLIAAEEVEETEEDKIVKIVKEVKEEIYNINNNKNIDEDMYIDYIEDLSKSSIIIKNYIT